MKSKYILGAAGLVICFGYGTAFAQTAIVECENANVTIAEDQVAAIKAQAGEDNWSNRVCEVVSQIDVSGFAEPTDVVVKMPNGEIPVKLQAK